MEISLAQFILWNLQNESYKQEEYYTVATVQIDPVKLVNVFFNWSGYRKFLVLVPGSIKLTSR